MPGLWAVVLCLIPIALIAFGCTAVGQLATSENGNAPTPPMVPLVPPSESAVVVSTPLAGEESSNPTAQASATMPDVNTRSADPEPGDATPNLTQDELPAIDVVIDDGTDGFSTTGTWFSATTGQQYGPTCAWAPRGIQNIAYFRPTLPQAGLYEVFAWWCGDPNHDQSQRAGFEIMPAPGRVATYNVLVNLQENAGQWQSLGVYPLQPDAGVTVGGLLSGNVVADAVRFVYVGQNDGTVITPTPIPTPFPWTNHPPEPLEQLTAGDLSARLGLVQPRLTYAHTPVKSVVERTFDDCVSFLRPGCGGERPGWLVTVEYQALEVVYRVAQDYRSVAVEPNEELARRQSLYLYGSDASRFFRVEVYPDPARTWHVNVAYHAGVPAVHAPLDVAMAVELQALAATYGPVTVKAGDAAITLYGYGPQTALSDEDAARIGAWAASFFDQLP